MDKISELPENVIEKILLLLDTKDAVAASDLSRRWKSLCKHVPSLKYVCHYWGNEERRFSRFVYWSLLLHKAPVLESFQLHIRNNDSSDIEVWITTAVHRCVIDNYASQLPIRLPNIIYSCKTLVALTFKTSILLDVPSQVFFPSLKSWILERVTYLGDGTVDRLLSSCPVLEDLVVDRTSSDDVISFAIKVSSLRSLSVRRSYQFAQRNDGYVIDAPFLKYVEIKDNACGFCLVESNMPELVKAKLGCASSLEKIMGSFAPVQRLSLYSSGSEVLKLTLGTFHRLVHLELDGYGNKVLSLLTSMLKHSFKTTSPQDQPGTLTRWNKPSTVSECLLSSLETLEWGNYYRSCTERAFVAYVLKNAARLKTVTISNLVATSVHPSESEQRFQMVKELAFTSRGSASCELIFN